MKNLISNADATKQIEILTEKLNQSSEYVDEMKRKLESELSQSLNVNFAKFKI